MNWKDKIKNRPVKGRVLFGFGAIYPKPWPWWAKETGEHNGNDFECYREDVATAGDGRVIKVGFEVGGYGNYVYVDHGDGVQSRYAHLQQILVHAGQKVKAGDTLGISGDTGSAEDVPHLHFEVLVNGVRVDGLEALEDQPSPPAPLPMTGEGGEIQEGRVPLKVVWKLREGLDRLNIRLGPGTQYEDVGDLRPGEVVEGVALDGEDVWVMLKDKRGWVAVLHQGVWYLEMEA